jgi:hypothetical protein
MTLVNKKCLIVSFRFHCSFRMSDKFPFSDATIVIDGKQQTVMVADKNRYFASPELNPRQRHCRIDRLLVAHLLSKMAFAQSPFCCFYHRRRYFFHHSIQVAEREQQLAHSRLLHLALIPKRRTIFGQ